jgi:hypothetical protein
MRRYGESKTTRIMMATVPHVTSGSELENFWPMDFCSTEWTIWLKFSTRFSDYITTFSYKSHSSINHLCLKAYLRGSSPNGMQNSSFCLVLPIMYIIKRTSCLKQKSMLMRSTTVQSTNTRTTYRDIAIQALINTVLVCSIRQAISYLTSGVFP